MPQSLFTSQVVPAPISSQVGDDRRQWAHLLPAGRIKTKDGRGPYLADNLSKISEHSFSFANTDKIPVDYDHAIDLAAPKGLPAPAAGWISAMEVRGDGLWGLIEWTANAAKAISEKEYRFLSPVIQHTAENQVLAIARASLTNNPNFTLTALNMAQKGEPMDAEIFLTKLHNALGLPADADHEAIVAAIGKLSESRNSSDPAQFVPIETFQQTLKELHSLRSGVSLQAAEHVVEEAMQGGKLLPFMKDWAVSLCQSNKAAFDDFLVGAGKPVREYVTSLHRKYDFSEARLEELNNGGGQQTEVLRNLGHSSEDAKTYGGKAK
ncbi:MAG: phage protease [Allorhizobium sp.]